VGNLLFVAKADSPRRNSQVLDKHGLCCGATNDSAHNSSGIGSTAQA
jgi:hypothetical protein